MTVLAPAASARHQQPVLVRKVPSPAAALPLHPARMGTPLPPHQLPQEPVPISQAGNFQRPHIPRPQGQGTPLPNNFCLPSEPVPFDSQEMQLKLQQQSPKMTIKPEVRFWKLPFYY